jgi:hypothetical protein
MLTFISSLLKGIFPQISQVKFCAHFLSPIYDVICTDGNYRHISEKCVVVVRAFRNEHTLKEVLKCDSSERLYVDR